MWVSLKIPQENNSNALKIRVLSGDRRCGDCEEIEVQSDDEEESAKENHLIVND